ncbi:MAG: hypothetical protein KDK27_04810 [Leptospiraceae bacterium]|nr:hypothetical protein [Leptospiraceae bacterium]
MQSDRIYIAWLQSACVITILVGLMAAAASHPLGEAPWLLLFDLLAWPLDGHPAAFPFTARAINAVLGGVMVGWACMMLLLVSGPLQKGDASIRRMMLIGLIAWFVVDSAGSFAAGIPGNVVLNVIFLLLFLPPLLAYRFD